jgi:predicted DNA-binding transcriptional regulator
MSSLVDLPYARNLRRIALELFRLVNDEAELARDKVWSEVVHLLERELAKRSLKGYVLNTPYYFKVSRVKREEFAKDLADKIEKLLKDNPGADEHEWGNNAVI